MMKCIGVIGAGVMGVGVAQNLVEVGLDVVLLDLSEEILQQAMLQIKNNLRVRAMLGTTVRAGEIPALLNKIRCSTDYAALAGCDFIIENVVEKWPVKQAVYAQLEQVCAPDCIFAANTSAIPITRIGSATRRADKTIGIHFMNPVPMKSAVEVIKGFHTSEATIATTQGLLQRMGKECFLVNDSPGFVSNRVLMLTINEAVNLVAEGVSDAATVDQIFKSCFGHTMGPLETADLIGLDTILFSVEVLYDAFNDSKYRPSPLLKKMVDAGLHGRKSGQGFYNYAL